jgi:hypothetical protein
LFVRRRDRKSIDCEDGRAHGLLSAIIAIVAGVRLETKNGGTADDDDIGLARRPRAGAVAPDRRRDRNEMK